MQSVFPLSWCQDRFAPKMQAGKAALETVRSSPVMEFAVLNKLKRKRTDSPEPHLPPRMQTSKKQRSDGQVLQQLYPKIAQLPQQSQRAEAIAQTPCVTSPGPLELQGQTATGTSSITSSTCARADSATFYKSDMDTKSATLPQPMSTASDAEDITMANVQAAPIDEVSRQTQLQQVIENEFNMQILMKHNELRLIDQELAKCQVALEQLRRCELRPYPGVERPSATVSAGTGPSTTPAPGYTRPSHAAPVGVTDGPYTRHYRHWLLPDAQFDPAPIEDLSPADGGPFTGVRASRGTATSRKSVQKSFTMPSQPTDSLHSLPNYPAPAHKDKSSPLVLRRSTDGQLVKLICNNCLRGNFSSIQGFLNHCRIAHKVDYKSHDAADVDCGRLLEEHEAANLPPDQLSFCNVWNLRRWPDLFTLCLALNPSVASTPPIRAGHCDFWPSMWKGGCKVADTSSYCRHRARRSRGMVHCYLRR